MTVGNWAHGVFESLRCYQGEFFLLEEHLDRLFASARSLGWTPPYAREEVTRRMKEDFARQKEKSVFVRVTLCRDWEKETYGLTTNIIPKKEYPQTYYNEGVPLATVPTRRNSPMAVSPQVKSNNALGGVFALEEGRAQEAFEPLLLNEQGYVTEGTICNFFIIKRGAMRTTPVYAGLLEGVTRNHVIRLAAGEGISVEEIPLTRHDIYNCEEAFLTNTSMGIMPVRMVDGRQIGIGTGRITKRLTKRLEEEIQAWEKRVDNDQN
ncbi:MAG: aminotransferase class IV [Candidatus Omnitrophica bacterium]|nr:aminotransferase class IV [Candidatus Omnitrophota bacterium]